MLIHPPLGEKGGPMPQRNVQWLPLLLVLLVVPAAPIQAQKAQALPELLKLASDYLASSGHDLGTGAADEEFTQYETSTGRMGTPKRVNSIIMLIGQDDGTIGSFRDVVAIDSVPVRPKDDRLAALFKTPTAASVATAQGMPDG